MISKKEFVEIINKLKEVNDFVEETNNKAKKLNDAIISDFFNASSLSISHETIVVKLLIEIFNLQDDDTLTWWLYEKDYGRNYEIGDMTVDGISIDLTTPEKLYDYLVKEKKKNEES
jgi:hypothetical protein